MSKQAFLKKYVATLAVIATMSASAVASVAAQQDTEQRFRAAIQEHDERGLHLATLHASTLRWDEGELAEGVLEEIQATAVQKLTGDLAQTSVTLNTTSAGSTTTGSTAVTLGAANAQIVAGSAVSGAGIAAGTTVTAVAGTNVTLSTAATATGASVALTFAYEQQVVGLSDWSIDFKLKTAEATTTDDSAWESSLPSTKSWTAKASFVFLSGDPSQAAQILAAITNQAVPLPWNFFPTIAQGREAFQGKAYIDGINFKTGMGKVLGLDVSLKGTGPLNVVSQQAPVANANTVTGQQAED